MQNFTVNECGPVHLTMGDGGNIEGLSASPFFGFCTQSAHYLHIYCYCMCCAVRCLSVCLTQNAITVARQLLTKFLQSSQDDVHLLSACKNQVTMQKYVQTCQPSTPFSGADFLRWSADKVFADSPGQCPAPNTTIAKSQPGGYCPTYVYDGQFCATSQPAWSAFREPAFGHGILTFENSTHALWQWNRNLDNESVEFDTVYVIRQLTCSNKASFAVGAAPSVGIATATAG